MEALETERIDLWLPAGKMSACQRFALAVPTSSRVNQDLWRSLLAARIQVEVDRDLNAAKAALRCSEEHYPEFWSLTFDVPPSGWGSAVAYSDSLHSIATAIDWTKAGHIVRLPLPTISELLECLP